MKKFKLFLVAAALTFGFASCNNDDVPYISSNDKPRELTISVVGVGNTSTRAIGGTGIGDEAHRTPVLSHAYIFILDGEQGTIVHRQPLNELVAGAARQTLQVEVSFDHWVYILGNVPASDRPRLNDPQNWAQLIELAHYLDRIPTDHQDVILANAVTTNSATTLGRPVAINPALNVLASYDGDNVEIVVPINPLITRLELHSITTRYPDVTNDAGASLNWITGFDVTAVFLDDIHSMYSWHGRYMGNMEQVFQSHYAEAILPPFAIDQGLWPSVARNDFAGDQGRRVVPVPGTAYVWNYNIAANTRPRFIIRMENMTVQAPALLPEYHPIRRAMDGYNYGRVYLTVRGYSTLPNGGGLIVHTLDRGFVYALGTPTNPFEFGLDDVGETPNPLDGNLIVGLQILPWFQQLLFPWF